MLRCATPKCAALRQNQGSEGGSFFMNAGKLLCLLALLTLISATGVFAQAPQNRIPQQIVLNGQSANGAFVMAATGGLQSFTCANPQQYATPDGGSQGWACYDQA